MKKQQEKDKLIKYAWSYYGEADAIYSDIFDYQLKLEEFNHAVEILCSYYDYKKISISASSIERELIRDIILTIYDDYKDVSTHPLSGFHRLEYGYFVDEIIEWYNKNIKQI